MSKMKSFQLIALTLSMLMIISMVKGRWLDLETYSTSMITVGVHNISNENSPNLRLEISNSSTFYAEKRCKSLYGFFPCADTMLESVCLMVMYLCFMILGDELTRKGSKVLFQWIGDKAFGESIFGVLKALPRIAIIVAPGVLSSASDAQNQVGFGVSMYAGTTVITLTLIWGIRIILSRHKFEKGSSPECDHQQDSSIKCLSLKDKLSFLTDTGVNIDKETRDMAVIMLCSLIPFVFVGLLHFVNTRAMTLFKLIVSVASLLLYFRYQVKNSWIRFRSLAFLKQENLRTRFFYHVVWLADFEELGDFGETYFERIFKEADENEDGYISHIVDNNKVEHKSHNVDNNGDGRKPHDATVDNNGDGMKPHDATDDNNGDGIKPHDELGELVQKMFMLEEKDEKSKKAVLIHFDIDKDGKISWEEFKKGCTNWLKEAISSGTVFENIWNQAIARNKRRPDIRIIERMMPKILEQVRKKHGSLVKDGKPDIEMIERLFSQYGKDNNNEIQRDELKEFIQTLDLGKAFDHDKILDELVKDFDGDKNQLVEKQKFVDGFKKWIEKAIDEKDNREKILALLKPEKPKATIVYAIFGITITITIASPFIASVKQFSTAAHIPFLFTSFVLAPIAMKAKMIIVKLLNALQGVRKNASLTFSEIYDQLVMDNLIGFVSLLLVVYIRGLSWTYSADVFTITIPCAIVGVFAIKRDTYPLWASISAILLYPVSVYIYYVLPNAS